MENVTDQANVFSALTQLANSKRHEFIMPLINQRIVATQLLVGDDIQLRTSLVSPDLYEREITKLVYNHIEFIDEQIKKPDFETFLRTITHIDRQSAVWAIVNASYDTLGSQTLVCPNCKYKFEDNITYDELIQPGTLTAWQETTPVSQFTIDHIETVDTEQIDSIKFKLYIPVIQKRIDLMNFIGIDKINHNFEQTKSLFSDSENMTLITALIELKFKTGQTQSITSMQEIHMVYKSYIPQGISKNVLTTFDDKLGKYANRFYKPYKCSKCSYDFDYSVDPEKTLYENFFI